MLVARLSFKKFLPVNVIINSEIYLKFGRCLTKRLHSVNNLVEFLLLIKEVFYKTFLSIVVFAKLTACHFETKEIGLK